MKKYLKVFIIFLCIIFAEGVNAIDEGQRLNKWTPAPYDGTGVFDYSGYTGFCLDKGQLPPDSVYIDTYLLNHYNEETNALEYGALSIVNSSLDSISKTKVLRAYYCSYLGLCNPLSKPRSYFASVLTSSENSVYEAAKSEKVGYNSSKRLHFDAKKMYSINVGSTRYIIVKIDISGFKSGGYLYINSIYSSKGSLSTKVSDNYSTDFSTYTNFSTGTNYASSSKTIYLLFELAGVTDSGSNITINYKYYDRYLTQGVYATTNGESEFSDSSSYQRFIVEGDFEFNNSVTIKDSNDSCEPTYTMPSLCNDSDVPDEEGYVKYEYKEGVISGTENVKTCILDNTDVKGNSYLEKKVNDYCSIYCKEDYTVYMPYKIDSVKAGKYFQLNVKINGTKSCYMSVDSARYANERIVLSYENNSETRLNIIRNRYNSCFSSSPEDYSYDPVIKYDYNEPIGSTTKWINDENNQMVCKNNVGSYTKVYCTDENFTNCSDSYSAGRNFIKWVSNASSTCTTPRVFYTLHPNNQIVIRNSEVENADLIDGLPVSINTPGGTYPYKISLENIGQYYGTTNKGRIFGDTNSTTSAKRNTESITVSEDSDIITEVKANEYVCTYNVPCPDCEIQCKGSCAYESDQNGNKSLHVDFRTISEGNINPNGRSMGYNWNIKNADNTLVAQKAKNTINEIEENAKKTSDELSEEDNNYTLKVTLTPSMISEIRKYNDQLENQGGYTNQKTPDNDDAIYCSDYNVTKYDGDESACKNAGYSYKENKCYAQNIFCYSKFIDDLIANYSNNVLAPNRDTAKTKAFSNVKDIDNTLTNNYWTITIYDNLDVNSDGIPDIGPSWK